MVSLFCSHLYIDFCTVNLFPSNYTSRPETKPTEQSPKCNPRALYYHMFTVRKAIRKNWKYVLLFQTRKSGWLSPNQCIPTSDAPDSIWYYVRPKYPAGGGGCFISHLQEGTWAECLKLTRSKKIDRKAVHYLVFCRRQIPHSAPLIPHSIPHSAPLHSSLSSASRFVLK